MVCDCVFGHKHTGKDKAAEINLRVLSIRSYLKSCHWTELSKEDKIENKEERICYSILAYSSI